MFQTEINIQMHLMCGLFFPVAVFLPALCPGAECFSRAPSSDAVTETGAVSASPYRQWWCRPPRLCAGATKQHCDGEPHQPWGVACKWTFQYHTSVLCCSGNHDKLLLFNMKLQLLMVQHLNGAIPHCSHKHIHIYIKHPHLFKC